MPVLEHINILLAEDDIDEQYFFTAAMKEVAQPTNITIVADGEKLTEYLMHEELVLPDVIFLDILMPRKDGIACLKEIKSCNKLKEIPIVMYSGSIGNQYVLTCYENGATYFLEKGNYLQLSECISKLLVMIGITATQATMEEFRFKLD